MASGLAAYGISAAVSAVGSMAMGAASRSMSGQDSSWSDAGMDALGGIAGGTTGSFMGSGTGGLGSMTGSLGSMMSSSPTGSIGGPGGSSGGILGSGTSGIGTSALGMMSQFGQSVFSNSENLGDAQYNSQMSELRNYNTMQQGVYNRSVSNKEAQLVHQEAEIRLASLRRELYRRNHSLGSHKGVRLDSGSIIDVHEDLIKQAGYDAEIVKYQAEIDSGRHMDTGSMSLWTAHSTSVLNQNVADNEQQQVSEDVSSSLMNSGMSMLNGVLNQ